MSEQGVSSSGIQPLNPFNPPLPFHPFCPGHVVAAVMMQFEELRCSGLYLCTDKCDEVIRSLEADNRHLVNNIELLETQYYTLNRQLDDISIDHKVDRLSVDSEVH